MTSHSSYSNVWCVLFIVVLRNISMLAHRVGGEPLVPCFFIFGDSFVSAETDELSNRRPHLKRPYGIDFPYEPVATRYTNGRTAIDIIAELLGFEGFIQPYTSISSSEVSKGVNYASSFTTNFHVAMWDVFGRQLNQHNDTINCYFGSSNATTEHLNKCLYSVGFGTEIHLFDFASQTTENDTVTRFLPLYVNNIRKLLDFGARKVIVHGLGPLGCTPTAMALHKLENNCGCVEKVNNAVQNFNAALRSKLDEINNDNPNARLLYIDTYQIFSDLSTAGFKVKNETCCPVEWDGLCLLYGMPCQNRTEYIFFDGFHPTEAANRIIADKSFNNISHLVSM